MDLSKHLATNPDNPMDIDFEPFFQEKNRESVDDIAAYADFERAINSVIKNFTKFHCNCIKTM